MKSLAITSLLSSLLSSGAGDSRVLLLIPYPKEVALRSGEFSFKDGTEIALSNPETPSNRLAAEILVKEVREDLKLELKLAPAAARSSGRHALTIGKAEPIEPTRREGGAYALSVTPSGLRIEASEPRGLFYGVQTLCQIVRANSRGLSIPCVTVQDWPGLNLRGYSDDITRGPSPTLSFLKREIELAAAFKLNFFTYYLEDQFFSPKRPDIGPEGGRLLPEELKECVRHAKERHVDIVGNQQSFGHFGKILSLPAYRHLAETPDVLSPALEESYRLLEDLYAAQISCLESEYFNVCCDEVSGLGLGPAKKLVAELGAARVYARHINRVHELVHRKFGKTMLLWGDIALTDPVILKEIPREVVLLNWGYDDRASFEEQIKPFAGFPFLVCPGVSCWSRILPDFNMATANIFNFCRDGAKHKALGTLNTTWDDDGENLFHYNWHGVLWGAECAWNPGTADLPHFNASFGPVFFGTKGDGVGKAVELLARTHRLPGYEAMLDHVFWRRPGELRAGAPSFRESTRRLSEIASEAISILEGERAEAGHNAEGLDALLFGARRMAHMARRDKIFSQIVRDSITLPGTEEESRKACEDVARSIELLSKELAALRQEYKRLYLLENRPYFLDGNLARYDGLIKTYDDFVAKLRSPPSGALSPAALLGLPGLEGSGALGRAVIPKVAAEKGVPMARDWTVRDARLRIPVAVGAGALPREDLPVEMVVTDDLLRSVDRSAWKSVQCVEVDRAGEVVRSLAAQFVDGAVGLRPSVSWVVPGAFEKGGTRRFVLYVGGSADSRPEAGAPAGAVKVTQEGQNWWAENGAIRILLGPEGAHLYRWHVKALGNLEITEEGDDSWHGFSDLGSPFRETLHEIRCVAAGPLLARFVCLADEVPVKVVSLHAGAQWVEVHLAGAAPYYWDFDRVANFAADAPQPGTAIFSSGRSSPVPPSTEAGATAQLMETNVTWGAKYRADGLTLALLLTDRPGTIRVGPGGSWGGCGIEGGPAASNFVTFGGKCETLPPSAFLTRLQETLSLKERPEISAGPAEKPPSR